MNIQQLEADLNARIMGLEDEESKLRRELECLRRLPVIAAEWQFDLAAALGGQKATSQDHPLETSCKEPERLQTAHPDPFDILRKKLTDKSDSKADPVFNSRTLLGAKA